MMQLRVLAFLLSFLLNDQLTSGRVKRYRITVLREIANHLDGHQSPPPTFNHANGQHWPYRSEQTIRQQFASGDLDKHGSLVGHKREKEDEARRYSDQVTLSSAKTDSKENHLEKKNANPTGLQIAAAGDAINGQRRPNNAFKSDINGASLGEATGMKAMPRSPGSAQPTRNHEMTTMVDVITKPNSRVNPVRVKSTYPVIRVPPLSPISFLSLMTSGLSLGEQCLGPPAICGFDTHLISPNIFVTSRFSTEGIKPGLKLEVKR
ncbi:hypothetical protein HDE_07328 [Halotydeus destructor]|nr:hypothetical protein HDE_07328 [Halotydeus destructor]